MNPYIEKLNTHLAQYPRYGEDMDSVVALLCHYYTEENTIENAVIHAEFLEMEPILDKLSRKDNDALFGTVLRLCREYADRAFLTGLRTGAQLFMELYQMASADTDQ